MRIAFVLLAIIALPGCMGAVAAVDTGVSVFGAAKAGTTAYHSFSMVKDMRNSEPVFRGHSGAIVHVKIAPREDNEQLPEDFKRNLIYLVNESAKRLDVQLVGCADHSQCSRPALGVQFIEDAYDQNLMHKVTMGDKIRGRLVYVNLNNGAVMNEVRIEAAEDYHHVMQLISGSIRFSMLKSFVEPGDESTQAKADALNGMPAIEPGREGRFSHS